MRGIGSIEAIRMSEEELNQIRYDLLALCDRLKEFSAKFFSAGEKGPALSEEWDDYIKN